MLYTSLNDYSFADQRNVIPTPSKKLSGVPVQLTEFAGRTYTRLHESPLACLFTIFLLFSQLSRVFAQTKAPFDEAKRYVQVLNRTSLISDPNFKGEYAITTHQRLGLVSWVIEEGNSSSIQYRFFETLSSGEIIPLGDEALTAAKEELPKKIGTLSVAILLNRKPGDDHRFVISWSRFTVLNRTDCDSRIYWKPGQLATKKLGDSLFSLADYETTTPCQTNPQMVAVACGAHLIWEAGFNPDPKVRKFFSLLLTQGGSAKNEGTDSLTISDMLPNSKPSVSSLAYGSVFIYIKQLNSGTTQAYAVRILNSGRFILDNDPIGPQNQFVVLPKGAPLSSCFCCLWSNAWQSDAAVNGMLIQAELDNKAQVPLELYERPFHIKGSFLDIHDYITRNRNDRDLYATAVYGRGLLMSWERHFSNEQLPAIHNVYYPARNCEVDPYNNNYVCEPQMFQFPLENPLNQSQTYPQALWSGEIFFVTHIENGQVRGKQLFVSPIKLVNSTLNISSVYARCFDTTLNYPCDLKDLMFASPTHSQTLLTTIATTIPSVEGTMDVMSTLMIATPAMTEMMTGETPTSMETLDVGSVVRDGANDGLLALAVLASIFGIPTAIFGFLDTVFFIIRKQLFERAEEILKMASEGKDTPIEDLDNIIKDLKNHAVYGCHTSIRTRFCCCVSCTLGILLKACRCCQETAKKGHEHALQEKLAHCLKLRAEVKFKNGNQTTRADFQLAIDLFKKLKKVNTPPEKSAPFIEKCCGSQKENYERFIPLISECQGLVQSIDKEYAKSYQSLITALRAYNNPPDNGSGLERNAARIIGYLRKLLVDIRIEGKLSVVVRHTDVFKHEPFFAELKNLASIINSHELAVQTVFTYLYDVCKDLNTMLWADCEQIRNEINALVLNAIASLHMGQAWKEEMESSLTDKLSKFFLGQAADEDPESSITNKLSDLIYWFVRVEDANENKVQKARAVIFAKRWISFMSADANIWGSIAENYKQANRPDTVRTFFLKNLKKIINKQTVRNFPLFKFDESDQITFRMIKKK